jgi:hypothetical protein
MIDPDDVAMRTAVASGIAACRATRTTWMIFSSRCAHITMWSSGSIVGLEKNRRMAHVDPITTRSRKVQESPERGKP